MKLKKVMAATLATMMCLSSFSMMNVWADKKEDSEPLVINYISARGETDAALKTLKKLAEDYKKDHPDFEFNVESIADRETYLQKIKILASSNELPDWFDADPEAFFEGLCKKDLIYSVDDLYDELGGAVALTCGSSFYIQHKTPDFEKPGACGIISLCY